MLDFLFAQKHAQNVLIDRVICDQMRLEWSLPSTMSTLMGGTTTSSFFFLVGVGGGCR